MALRYRDFPPPARLAPVIERIWMLEGDMTPASAPEPVFPDGRAEIVVHFGDPFDVVSEQGARARQASILFAGQLPDRLLLQPAGRVATVGVRFHPHGASSLLAEPQHRLAGVPHAIGALLPGVERLLARVRERHPFSPAAAVAVADALLRCADTTRIDRRVAHAVRLISRSGGRLSIDDVAANAEVTGRHLERLFLEHVGLSPKRLASVTRFQRALRRLSAGAVADPLAMTAAACGYFDQSHLVRDFRRFAGCAPSEYLRRPEGPVVFAQVGN